MDPALRLLATRISPDLSDNDLAELLAQISIQFQAVELCDLEGDPHLDPDLHSLLERKLASVDERLGSLVLRPPAFLSAVNSINDDLFQPPAMWGPSTTHTWKPSGILWSSPLVDGRQDKSSWTLWLDRAGDVASAKKLVSIDRSGTRQIVIGNLAEADSLMEGHQSFSDLAQFLLNDGVHVIDFSWRVVIEAELSALRGERGPRDFPCMLGSECSLWLTAPRELVRSIEPPDFGAR